MTLIIGGVLGALALGIAVVTFGSSKQSGSFAMSKNMYYGSMGLCVALAIASIVLIIMGIKKSKFTNVEEKNE